MQKQNQLTNLNYNFSHLTTLFSVIFSLLFFAPVSSANQSSAKVKEGKTIMESEKLESKEEKNSASKDVALLKTEKGDIKIKLYLDKAPITAGNFKDLVERGFYNGLIFQE